MNKYENMKQELKGLIKEGKTLYQYLIKDEKTGNLPQLVSFIRDYEKWYSKALVVVRVLLPTRVEDFSLMYQPKSRKELKHSTYTISDALRGLTHTQGWYDPSSALTCMWRQVNILQACLDCYESKIFDLQAVLQADIFDSELDSAKHLVSRGFYRAAGAMCGVMLEKHLKSVCDHRNLPIKKKNPSIAEYNDTLKDVAYDTIEWRRIQRLGDIRNLCDHNKDREPTKEEVEELISGTDRVIKTIF